MECFFSGVDCDINEVKSSFFNIHQSNMRKVIISFFNIRIILNLRVPTSGEGKACEEALDGSGQCSS